MSVNLQRIKSPTNNLLRRVMVSAAVVVLIVSVLAGAGAASDYSPNISSPSVISTTVPNNFQLPDVRFNIWNEDGTVDVAAADIADADTITVTFVGRKIGDTIGNGNVEVNSNIKIARFLVGLADMTYADQFYGDISADGKLEVNDNIMLARYLAGILDENFEVK